MTTGIIIVTLWLNFLITITIGTASQPFIPLIASVDQTNERYRLNLSIDVSA